MMGAWPDKQKKQALKAQKLKKEVHAHAHSLSHTLLLAYHKEEESVERADVVEDVGVSHDEAQKGDEEVEAPEHLKHTNCPEVTLMNEKESVPQRMMQQ
jgi:hypothetical protein